MHFTSQTHGVLGLGGHHFTEEETGSRMVGDQPKVQRARMSNSLLSSRPVNALFISPEGPERTVSCGSPICTNSPTLLFGPLSSPTHLLLLPIYL